MNGYTNGTGNGNGNGNDNDNDNGTGLDAHAPRYSLLRGANDALTALTNAAANQLPNELRQHLRHVTFRTASDGDGLYFPCPFKETEATAALKAVEASAVAAIADLRHGHRRRKITVNLESTSAFLFSTYIATVGGLNKADPKVKRRLKDTDLLQAQSILYRRLAANLYETKIPNEYFHIHGSLEAGKTLKMIGLESHRPDLTDYRECIDTIETHVKRFTATELEDMNARERQAGVTALKWEDFQKTDHGRALLSLPPWTVTPLETSSPRSPLPRSSHPDRPLHGLRVLELCRIIAGPAIGRTLAEYGASVLKITSPHLSDVPFFQVDGNTGKHTTDLDLKTPSGRAVFESLLETADVILDGYRPGALARLGYSPEAILEKIKWRGKGIVYVAEDCFGSVGPWAGRPGWQQIADCVTGVAWAQGQFMGLAEPVVPPFPMSDYGTGCMGAIAALTGLLHRATHGGSWYGRTSLCQYDVFLQRLGLHSPAVQQHIRQKHDAAFFALRHADSVDEVGARALRSMKRAGVADALFHDRLMQGAWSEGFDAEVRWVRSAVQIEGVKVGFERPSRPNGFDAPTWEGWEVDKTVVDG